jgi:hypothetical protein
VKNKDVSPDEFMLKLKSLDLRQEDKIDEYEIEESVELSSDSSSLPGHSKSKEEEDGEQQTDDAQNVQV